MVEHAKQSFDLMMVQPDGSTKRQHLEAVQRQTGMVLEELKIPELPPVCSQVWKWFLTLNAGRQSGMQVSPLSFSDISAYFNLIEVKPTEEELDILRILDNIVLELYQKEQKKASKK